MTTNIHLPSKLLVVVHSELFLEEPKFANESCQKTIVSQENQLIIE